MPEPESILPEIYLGPGEMVLAREPTILATILGSCIGVTFWCARLGVGALCHSVLPTCPRPDAGEINPAVGNRYVDFCIQSLASQFDRLGALRSEVEVKMFGGADVNFVDHVGARPTVGKLNSEAAIQLLADEGYAVTASSIGSTFGRKIRFNTGSGEVQLVRLIGRRIQE
jgi:chemotaxis protein CheD